jgi:hypothetical protein
MAAGSTRWGNRLGSVPLSQLAIGTKGGLGAFVDALTNPVAIILAIALAALSAWLMGRLRTSR